jgi:rhodanese-related sulfurtransferase
MNHLPEYISHHAYLAIATVLAAIIAVVFELRARSLAAAAISSNVAIALQNKGALILDVRTAEEFAGGHIIDAKNIPLDKLAEQADTLKKWREKPVVVCCESGARSAQAAKLLKSLGFAQAMNMQGGLASWRSDNLPLSKKG